MKSKTFWNKKNWHQFKIKFYTDGSVMFSKYDGSWNNSIYFTKEDWEIFSKELSAFRKTTKTGEQNG